MSVSSYFRTVSIRSWKTIAGGVGEVGLSPRDLDPHNISTSQRLWSEAVRQLWNWRAVGAPERVHVHREGVGGMGEGTSTRISGARRLAHCRARPGMLISMHAGVCCFNFERLTMFAPARFERSREVMT